MAKLNYCAEGGSIPRRGHCVWIAELLDQFESADRAAAKTEVSARVGEEREEECEQGHIEAEDKELELGSAGLLNGTQDNKVHIWVLPMELVSTYCLRIVTTQNVLWHL